MAVAEFNVGPKAPLVDYIKDYGKNPLVDPIKDPVTGATKPVS